MAESGKTHRVVIVGAGFAGLWTTYYLLKANPALRIVVIDAIPPRELLEHTVDADVGFVGKIEQAPDADTVAVIAP